MFDSEFCRVEYLEKINAVYLMWKKFSCKEAYRAPTIHALNLLKEHCGSNFIIDARDGFEDEEEDVAWGFTELLPSMSKTDCSCVVMIMEKANAIEDEMNMWAKEFGRYFTVLQAATLDGAVKLLETRSKISLHVTYTIKDGARDDFYRSVQQAQIPEKSKEEPGNLEYKYYFSPEKGNQIFLVEAWADSASQQLHLKTPHYLALQKLKTEYVLDVTIKKYFL